MLSRRQFLTSAALSSVALPSVLSGVKASSSSRATHWSDDLRPASIAIIGDLQRTSLAEAVLMARSQNDREREAILDAVAADRPDMLLLVGDQVSTGDDDDDWNYFDRVMERIKTVGIPVRSIYGNHDYGLDKSRCIRNFMERFPHQTEEGASLVRLGAIALVTVDTNFDQLTSSQIERQRTQYRKWIAELEDDPEVRGVIVAAHHPPYTNSELGPTAGVISQFTEPFYRARKTRLFLSGHVHSYERFVAGDKTFIVTGGGGGPLRSVDVTAARRFQNDAFRSKATVRPFHYIRLDVSDTGLKAETRFLKGSSFVTGDRFEIGLYGPGLPAR
jgi:Icc-related predicted phosphoesterase